MLVSHIRVVISRKHGTTSVGHSGTNTDRQTHAASPERRQIQRSATGLRRPDSFDLDSADDVSRTPRALTPSFRPPVPPAAPSHTLPVPSAPPPAPDSPATERHHQHACTATRCSDPQRATNRLPGVAKGIHNWVLRTSALFQSRYTTLLGPSSRKHQP